MSEEKRVQGARDIALDALMQVERANAGCATALRAVGSTAGTRRSRRASPMA